MYYVGRHVYVAEAKYTYTCAAIHGRRSRIYCIRAVKAENNRRPRIKDGKEQVAIRLSTSRVCERDGLLIVKNTFFIKRYMLYI